MSSIVQPPRGSNTPTEAERTVAMLALKYRHPSAERPTYEELPPTAQWNVDGVAQALADQRAKYEAVAVQMDELAVRAQSQSNDFPFEYGIEITARDASERIRGVA